MFKSSKKKIKKSSKPLSSSPSGSESSIEINVFDCVQKMGKPVNLKINYNKNNNNNDVKFKSTIV